MFWIFDFFEIILDLEVIFLDFSLSNALTNHYIVVWVTQPEWPKGAKDEVKQARRGLKGHHLQFGASSPAKHGGAYFSAVYGVMKDPIAALGPYENQEP